MILMLRTGKRATIRPVLHEQIRAVRMEMGLSQAKLAKRAAVPRSQLQKLENGQNVTLETFLKIVVALPDLKRLTLGPTELQLRQVDVDALRERLHQLITDAAGVLATLEPAGARPAAATAATSGDTPPAGAVRHRSASSEQRRAEALNPIAEALARGERLPDDDS